MIMILFGALSAGTKTYLLCRSDRHAFTSTFCNTLPVGCLKFCLAWFTESFGAHNCTSKLCLDVTRPLVSTEDL